MIDQDFKYKLSLFEAVLNASQDGILVVDHKSGSVRQINSRFLELWRIPNDLAKKGDDKEMIGFVLEQLNNPQGFIKLVEELYANPLKKSFDILNFKDGRIFERHSEPLMIDAQVNGRVWYFRDITEKIRNEALLIQSGKMATLGEMAGGIAHEINTPLSAMILNAEILAKRIRENAFSANDLPAEIEKRLSKIIATGEKIAKIVSGMKFFSRDASSENIQSFPIEKVILETTDLCREKFKHHQIDLKINASILTEVVQGRAVQLSQVLMNLLSNSFDAVQNLEQRWISIEGQASGDFLNLMVTDSGTGIEADVAEKMFQPFYTTKGVGNGTGLGLSISKGIIQNQGGELTYDQNSRHTRFIIRIPRAIPKRIGA